jgi:hypothetical protein
MGPGTGAGPHPAVPSPRLTGEVCAASPAIRQRRRASGIRCSRAAHAHTSKTWPAPGKVHTFARTRSPVNADLRFPCRGRGHTCLVRIPREVVTYTLLSHVVPSVPACGQEVSQVTERSHVTRTESVPSEAQTCCGPSRAGPPLAHTGMRRDTDGPYLPCMAVPAPRVRPEHGLR